MNENMKAYMNKAELNPMDVEDRLKYVKDRVSKLFDYVASISDNTYNLSTYKPEELTETVLNKILANELENIGIPRTYKVYELFNRFIPMIGKIDESATYDDICGMMTIDFDNVIIDYPEYITTMGVKLAITKMKQKADFSKAHIFKGISKASNNYDILMCLYNYFNGYIVDQHCDLIKELSTICNHSAEHAVAVDTMYSKILDFIDYLVYTTEFSKEIESGAIYSKYELLGDTTSLKHEILQIIDNNVDNITMSVYVNCLDTLEVIGNFEQLVMCGIIKITSNTSSKEWNAIFNMISLDNIVFGRVNATCIALNNLAVLLDKYDDENSLRFNEIEFDSKYPVRPEEFREYLKAIYDYLMEKKKTK